jgi:outer membrane lipoprotein-sorting protein
MKTQTFSLRASVQGIGAGSLLSVPAIHTQPKEKREMRFATILRSAVAVSAFTLLVPPSAGAQDARAIVQKMVDAYSGAKTYQATYATQMAMGQGTMTTNTDVKKSNGKVSVHSTSQGAPGMPAGGMNMLMVDDGQFQYVYLPAMNQYMKRPHGSSAGMLGMASITPGDMAKQVVKDTTTVYKLLAPATMDGRAVYVIEATNPKQPAMKNLLYVDKASYHLKQVKLQGGQGRSIVLNIKNEKLNAPIPDSAFVFTPPKGATEMKGGPGAAPGGGAAAPH